MNTNLSATKMERCDYVTELQLTFSNNYVFDVTINLEITLYTKKYMYKIIETALKVKKCLHIRLTEPHDPSNSQILRFYRSYLFR